MTLIDILTKAGLAGDELLGFLGSVAEKFPDLAPKAQELAAKLATAIAADNLVALASALPAEIAQIAQGKLDPREHPSDAA